MSREERPTARRRPRAGRMRPDERLTQIVDAATSLIAERGFWGLTLRDVAYSCDLTEAGLLHHVGNKDRLLINVLKRRDHEDITALMERLQLDRFALIDAEELAIDIIDLSRALVAHNATQPEIVQLYSVLDAEALDVSHPAHEFFADRELRALRLFTRAARPRPDAEQLARLTLATMDGLQLQWLRRLDDIDLVAEWEQAISRYAG